MKEWLCLTCQMQRALSASESAEPPQMKAQESPSKVATPLAAAIQKKDIISTQNADVPDKNIQDSPATEGGQQRKEEISLHAKRTAGSIPAQTKEEKIGSLPTKEVPDVTASPTKNMRKIVSQSDKPTPAQASEKTDIQTSLSEKKDIIPPGSPTAKEVLKKEDDKAVTIHKSADKPVLSTEEDKQMPSKKSNLVSKSALPDAEPTAQGSAGLPGIDSPKSPRAAAKTTEAVTGKMLGFGSSLFSSASTLITSAVQETRTTPPALRKMSAPAQVSEKMSASEVSPKSSPPVSPRMRMTSTTETKLPDAQKPIESQTEKTQDQLQQAKTPPSGQDTGPSEPARHVAPQAAAKVGQSTCPLCKADLNLGSKDLPNFNTCTECKSTVCNKCGFSPMPSAKEVMKLPTNFMHRSFFSFSIFGQQTIFIFLSLYTD